MMTRRALLGAGVGAAIGLSIPRHFQVLAGQPKTSQRFVWNPEYSFEWAHRFPYWLFTATHPSPIDKYVKLREALVADSLMPSEVPASPPLLKDDFLRVHTQKYFQRLEYLADSIEGLVNVENIITPQILDFVKASCAGTYDAARKALASGRAINLSGGFHHAFPNHEEGFCHLNDVAIAIKKLQAEGKIKTAMIVDLDVHHGNGNAYIFQRDPTVFTFDIYQQDNYPGETFPMDCPIPLLSTKGIDDTCYLTELRKHLRPSLERFRPDLVFVVAGADPFKEDRLGGFKLTHQGLEERDRYVMENTKSLGIPTVVVLGGGYAQNIADTVRVHYNTAKIVAEKT